MRITLIYHLEAHEYRLCRMEKSGIFPNKQLEFLGCLLSLLSEYAALPKFSFLFFWVFRNVESDIRGFVFHQCRFRLTLLRG